MSQDKAVCNAHRLLLLPEICTICLFLRPSSSGRDDKMTRTVVAKVHTTAVNRKKNAKEQQAKAKLGKD